MVAHQEAHGGQAETIETMEAAANGIAFSAEPGTRPKPRHLALAEAVQGPVLVVSWSSAFVAGVIGTRAGTPLLLCFLRFACAALLLTALAFALRSRWPRGKTLAHTVFAGVFMHAIQFCGFYYGMAHGLGGGVSALIQGLSSMIVVVLAALTLGERLTKAQWLGFAIGIVGVVIAIEDRLAFSPVAVASAFLGLAGISVGTYWQKRFVSGVDVVSGTAVQLAASAPLGLAATFLFEHPQVTDTTRFAGAVLWIVLVNSLGVFLLLNHMLRTLPASSVSTLFLAVPATTSFLSWAFAGQTMSTQAVVGLVIGGFGAALAAYGAARASAKRASPA
ncbi:MAG: DMT family transporter [Segniliparus sp.]|uniref:DMT family transporter n=1 Tax=Segniliparus sp. TaxID=2804064 RepID=UPI003F31D0BB